MEEIHNLVTGCFRLDKEKSRPDDDEEEEEDSGELQFLPYRDVVSSGASLVQYHKPRRVRGVLLDLRQPKHVIAHVAGNFHLQESWWQLTILRTKKLRDKVVEAKDYWALCYRLRDDPGALEANVVHMFLNIVLDITEAKNAHKEAFFRAELEKFYEYLRQKEQYDDLSLSNLEERVTAYPDSFSEEERSGTPHRFKQAILLCSEYRYIQASQAHPQLFHYLSQLFPGHFLKLLTVSPEKLDKLAEAFEENPGLLAFKEMLKKHCGLLGFETSSEALLKAGLMRKVPQDVCDAIYMYEYLKKETRENGHTCIMYEKILDTLGSQVVQFEEGLDFLNSNKITKTVVEAGHRLVYLMTLWKAENQIVKGITSLITGDMMQPWKLDVDWNKEDYASICSDHDQRHAAELITKVPVVAISGKGGCGKTYVVTKITTTATVHRSKPTNPCASTTSMEGAGDGQDATMGDNPVMDTDCTQTEDEPGYNGIGCEAETKAPDEIEMLLTAPTGKAANLLGKRAKTASFTLHQVIYSYRLKPPDMPWRHEKVNTLVVDECSLVSVSTFAFLIELLLKHACLRKVILLGDIRQLPSIEPGNFLADTFTGLSRLGYAVELRTNHRAESQMIVDNATRISKKMYPLFDRDKFVMRRLPECNPSTSGNDYTGQDIVEDVLKLLHHEALCNHVTSQFVSFTRRVCDSINDVCCKHYNNHRLKDEHGKYVFRTGDKVCCTKNGYVNLYEYEAGRMICQLKDSKGDSEENEGGVNRQEPGEESEETSLLEQHGHQSAGTQLAETIADPSTQAGKKEKKGTSGKKKEIRLSNGEIFFIIDEKAIIDDNGKYHTYLQLSDKDKLDEMVIWVDRKQLRQACRIRHAWARTIHTFQGSENDTIVYIVGNRSWRQNWQHVYTAVTRGRKSVFIVSPETTLRNAVKRNEIKRQTSLKKQLIEKLQKNKATREILAPVTPMKSQVLTNENVRHNLHDLVQTPIRRQLVSDQGDTSMNSTQEVTDILASLAEEHNSPRGSDNSADKLNYDSDEAFTRIKDPKRFSSNRQHMKSKGLSVPGGQASGTSVNVSGSLARSTVGQPIRIHATNIASSIGKTNSGQLIMVDDATNVPGGLSIRGKHEQGPGEDIEMVDSDTDSETESCSQSLLSTPEVNINRRDKTSKKTRGNVDTGNSLGKTRVNTMENVTYRSTQKSTVTQQSNINKALENGNSTTFAGNSGLSLKGKRSNRKFKPQLEIDIIPVSSPGVEYGDTPELAPAANIHLPVQTGASQQHSVCQDVGDHQFTPGEVPFSHCTPTCMNRGANSDKSAKNASYPQHKVTNCVHNDLPVTPHVFSSRNNVSPDSVHNAVKTGSPFIGDNSAADFQYHISTGLSPLEPGGDESFSSLQAFRRKSTQSTRLSACSPIQSFNKNSIYNTVAEINNDGTKKSRTSLGKLADIQRFNDTDDIQEPRSNESNQSQWSEVDESEYMHLAEVSTTDGTGSTKHDTANNTSTPNPNDSFRKSRQSSLTYHRLNSRSSLTGMGNADVSTNSQWSEADDDQLLNLDLDDITAMTQPLPNNEGARAMHTDKPYPTYDNQHLSNNEGACTSNTTKHHLTSVYDTPVPTARTTKSNSTYDTPLSTMSSSLYRNIQSHNSPVTNVTSSPLLSDTDISMPSSSKSSSPRSKGSSPQKRPHPSNDYLGSSVSPLKRSLSQLRFK